MSETSNKTVIYEMPSALTLLGVAFVVLRLTGYITWSWWWVTAPFWAGIAIVISFYLITAVIGVGILGAVAGVAAILEWREKKQLKKSYEEKYQIKNITPADSPVYRIAPEPTNNRRRPIIR